MATKVKDEDGMDFELEIERDEEGEGKSKSEVEIEDDTPEEDRGKEPMPKEIVDELENDELDEYSDSVKQRMKQLKKVWHDERREKERYSRESQEAMTAAQRLMEENRNLRKSMSGGEMELINAYKQSAEYEQEMARRSYKEAYDNGDVDLQLEAQEKLSSAANKLWQVNNYKPTLQEQEVGVEQAQQMQPPKLDQKTVAWQERNTWWGSDDEMTASALGLHQKLVRERGPQFAGTDEYWDAIDTTVRRRFPEYFGDEEVASNRASKSAQTVAPASRSRSPRKIVLKKSQLAVAKKLGVTPEEYARAVMKMEE
jgi:hypothetical protein